MDHEALPSLGFTPSSWLLEGAGHFPQWCGRWTSAQCPVKSPVLKSNQRKLVRSQRDTHRAGKTEGVRWKEKEWGAGKKTQTKTVLR